MHADNIDGQGPSPLFSLLGPLYISLAGEVSRRIQRIRRQPQSKVFKDCLSYFFPNLDNSDSYSKQSFTKLQ